MPKHIVVVGGGVIGASISYHLALLSQPCIVIEQCAVACAASGKSAGFLASNWCDTTALKQLARPSFQMHRQLAQQLDTDIDYRTLHSFSLSLVHHQSPTASSAQPVQALPPLLSWLDAAATPQHAPQQIGTPQTNAQVHPYKLTHALLQSARKRCNSSVLIAKLEHVHKAPNHTVQAISVRYPDGRLVRMPCDVLVLAMGPWSSQATCWFPRLPTVMAHKYASLVVKAKVQPAALFLEYINANGQLHSPEIYPRHDEVYLCQSAIPDDLPSDPAAISIHSRDRADLLHLAQALSSQFTTALNDPQKLVAQACNLPVSPDGLPIIGEIPDTAASAYIATAHSCWGILNSPATGKAIAQLIVNGNTSIDISSFSPARFG